MAAGTGGWDRELDLMVRDFQLGKMKHVLEINGSMVVQQCGST